MPRYNGTGPLGSNLGVGWGLSSYGAGIAYGRRGGGRGRGLSWRRFWGYYPVLALSKKKTAEMLSEEIEILEQKLKAIKVRLVELKSKK